MSNAARQPDTYRQLITRSNAILGSPRAQVQHQASIEKLPHESDEDWERFMDEISSELTVTAVKRGDGGVDLSWDAPVV